MRRRNKISRIVPAALGAALLSFILTGVAENAVSGIPSAYPAAEDIFKLTGNMCAVMSIPTVFVPQSENEKSGEYGEDTKQTSENSVESKDETSSEQTSAVINTDNSGYEPIDSSSPESTADSELKVPDTSESTVEVNAYIKGKANLISQNIRNEKSIADAYNDRSGTVMGLQYGSISGDNAIDLEYGQLNNCTKISSSIILSEGTKPPSIKIQTDSEPQVLIMHTHTSEAYEPIADGKYDPEFIGRSLCPSDSVVGIGAIIAQKLADKGICTIHDGTVYDDPVYSNSYARSNEKVSEILEQYPTIKVVLDIHRDGIADGDVRIAPVTEINGKEAAQIMIICGCDDGSGILPDYMENLRFATYLQSSIAKDYPTLARPMLFDYRYYNQDLTTGSLLIEVGALGNTKKQAAYAAELLGDSIAGALLKLEG